MYQNRRVTDRKRDMVQRCHFSFTGEIKRQQYLLEAIEKF